MMRRLVTAAAVALWTCSAGAQPRPSQGPAAPAAQPSPSRPSALGNLGTNNKEPIKIDADRLDVFDKEQRAVFTGSVVAVQGESTIKCTVLTVLYDQQRGQAKPGQAKPAPAPVPGAAGPSDGAIRQIDCQGPVTIVSRTQTATGDNATFDRTANRILLTGNVALSDGPNVTLGERIVYDLNTGIANVETKPGGRVRAMFVPGSGADGKPGGGPAPAQPGARRPPPATN